MELNLHLAAYGLFQHQFAYLDGSLAKTLVLLMKCDAHSERPLKKRLTFGQRLALLEELSDELANRYDLPNRVPDEMKTPTQPQDNPYRDLKMWVERARGLSHWRNERVHGRVAYDTTTGAAYLVNNSDTVLDADHDSCIKKSQEAYRLVDVLEQIATNCMGDMRLTKAIDSI